MSFSKTPGWHPVSQRWAQRNQQKPTINCPVSPHWLCCRQWSQWKKNLCWVIKIHFSFTFVHTRWKLAVYRPFTQRFFPLSTESHRWQTGCHICISTDRGRHPTDINTTTCNAIKSVRNERCTSTAKLVQQLLSHYYYGSHPYLAGCNSVCYSVCRHTLSATITGPHNCTVQAANDFFCDWIQ